MSIFGFASQDKVKNLTESLNRSTTNVVNNNSVQCAQTVQQIQRLNPENVNTSGGNINFLQSAGLNSKCVLDSVDQKKLIDDIANDLVQSHKTDKGAAGLFTFVSNNEQENIARVRNELQSAYSALANVKCDLSTLQEQNIKLRNINTGGGNITFSQQSNIDSACNLVSNINTEVAKKLQSSIKQTTETTIPSTLYFLIAGGLLLAVVGIVLFFVFGGEEQPRRPPMYFPGPRPFPRLQQFAPPNMFAPVIPQQYPQQQYQPIPAPQASPVLPVEPTNLNISQPPALQTGNTTQQTTEPNYLSIPQSTGMTTSI